MGYFPKHRCCSVQHETSSVFGRNNKTVRVLELFSYCFGKAPKYIQKLYNNNNNNNFTK